MIKLADMLSEKAIEHTAMAQAAGLLKPFAPELSTLTVIGAAERLLYAALSGQLKTEPLEVPGQLISLVLDGIRVPEGGLGGSLGGGADIGFIGGALSTSLTSSGG